MSTSSNTTVVTDRGQVSIPAELRKALGLAKGQRLIWERVSDRELRVIRVADDEPAGAMSVLGFARRFRPEPRTTESWMDDLRDGES